MIAADGRNSVVRSQVGIEQHRDPTHHLMAGMLVDKTIGWPADLQIFGTEARVNFLAFPQSPERVRLYICYATEDKKRFAGADNQARFLDAFHLASVRAASTSRTARRRALQLIRQRGHLDRRAIRSRRRPDR